MLFDSHSTCTCFFEVDWHENWMSISETNIPEHNGIICVLSGLVVAIKFVGSSYLYNIIWQIHVLYVVTLQLT